ncbi:MAG: SH3 domain-containing protein [Phycisphaerae bacterium]
MRIACLISTAAAILWLASTPAGAADPPKNSAFPWEGELTGTHVYVRSGAGSNYYPTTKLNTGDRVLVLGEKFGWYRILPPARSFSYVDAAKVEPAAGGTRGTIKEDRVYVRAGSHLVKRRTSTQLVLNRGAVVEILGKADGFYKIAPPRGAALFISKQYVRKVPDRLQTGLVQRYLTRLKSPERKTVTLIDSPRRAEASRPPAATPKAGAQVAANRPQRTDGAPAAAAAGPANASRRVAAGPTEDPPITVDESLQSLKEKPLATGDTGASPDEPAAPKLASTGRYRAMLAAIESDLIATMGLPLKARELEPLVRRYEEIASQSEEVVPARYARIRVKQLKNQIEMRRAMAKLSEDSAELEAYRAKMNSERMKILRARAEARFEKFDLEGELRKSYAFAPEKRRYRLVDPKRHATIAYVDVPIDVKEDVEHMIGRLVGIRVSDRRYSASARIPIARVASITDLTPRPLDDRIPNDAESSNRRNTEAEIAKSPTEAAPLTGKAEPPKKAVATAGEEGERDR